MKKDGSCREFKLLLLTKGFAVQVTTARKALTLLLSYILFTKPLTGQHGSGLLLITMGIVLKMMPEPFPKKYLALPTRDPKYEPKAEAAESEEKADYKV